MLIIFEEASELSDLTAVLEHRQAVHDQINDCFYESESVLGDLDAAWHLLHEALIQVGELLFVLNPLSIHLGKQPVTLPLLFGKMVRTELTENAVQHRLLLSESAVGPI